MLPTNTVGRYSELRFLRSCLLRANVQLLTLTGAPGIGKTRLALALARSVAEEFAHGVVFVELHTTTTAKRVIDRIALAVGVKNGVERGLVDRLKRNLLYREQLLVLDNCEQVIAAAPHLAELLSTCPKLKILATSREPFRLQWEHQFDVPPLDFPDPQHLPPLESLRQYPAVALFLDRAQLLGSELLVGESNLRAVAGICSQLDGLPLAIELAATYLKVLSPELLLGRLQRRLSLLTLGLRDHPPRHRSLRAALQWSYELLSGDERRLFRWLGVFMNGFTLDAAEAIGNAIDLPTPVAQGVGALVDKSLLRRESGANGEPRFRMLETIREYALERLQRGDEWQRVKDAHAAYFLDLVEKAHEELRRGNEVAWMAALELEHDNLREALDHYASSDGAEGGLRLAGGLRRFWEGGGYLAEGLEAVLRALAHPGALNLAAPRARALAAAGSLASRQGRYGEARAYFQGALAIARDVKDRSLMSFAFSGLGLIARFQQDYQTARSYFEEALGLRRELNDQRGIAYTLHHLGIIAASMGDFARARSLYEESLAMRRESNDKLRVAYVLADLGRLACLNHHWTEATELSKESLMIQYGMGDRRFIPNLLEDLASVAAFEGRAVRAAKLFGAAEALREATGLIRAPELASEYDRGMAAIRARLDDQRYASAWAAGRALGVPSAVSFALGREAPAREAQPRRAAPWLGGSLTTRESEVARLIARGLTNRQIARLLIISERTSANHVQHILNKTGFRSRAQIAVWAAADQGPSDMSISDDDEERHRVLK